MQSVHIAGVGCMGTLPSSISTLAWNGSGVVEFFSSRPNVPSLGPVASREHTGLNLTTLCDCEVWDCPGTHEDNKHA